MNFTTELDHIVIGCHSLDEGRAWCRDTFGVDAASGGKHANVGTHNLLLGLGASHYLEIIAIDPEGDTPAFPRWFGLDTEAVKAHIKHEPRLIAWVARVARLNSPIDAIEQLAQVIGNSANVVRPAERGDFRWRFAFTEDGSRPRVGVLPYFIQWDVTAHPCERLGESAVTLSSLVLADPVPDEVSRMLESFSVHDEKVHVGQSTSPHLVATLNSPNGLVVLE